MMETDREVRRLGVIGDVHAEDGRLGSALSRLVELGVDRILCTGDLVDGEGCPDRCVQLLKQYEVATVRGNHDRWILEEKARHIPNAHTKACVSQETLDYLSALPVEVFVRTISGNLLLCHGIARNDLRKVWPGTERMGIERSKELDQLISEGRYRFLINGHMHFKTMMHFHTLTLINAGTIRGQHWPGFMVIDFETQQIQAYELSEHEIVEGKLTSLEPADEDQRWTDTGCFSGDWQPNLLFNRH